MAYLYINNPIPVDKLDGYSYSSHFVICFNKLGYQCNKRQISNKY